MASFQLCNIAFICKHRHWRNANSIKGSHKTLVLTWLCCHLFIIIENNLALLILNHSSVHRISGRLIGQSQLETGDSPRSRRRRDVAKCRPSHNGWQLVGGRESQLGWPPWRHRSMQRHGVDVRCRKIQIGNVLR